MIYLITFLLGMLSAIGSQHQKRPQHDPKTTTGEQENGKTTRIIFSEEDVQEHRRNQKDQKAIQQSLKRAAWLTFWAVSIYAGITLAIYCASNRAANAAKESADAATKAATTAEQQLEVAERPWVAVVVEPAGWITWNDGGLQYSFKITYKNIGKTPAFEVTHFESTTLKRLEDVGAAQRDLAKGFINATLDTANIMPGDERQTIVHTQVSREDVEAAIAYSNQRWPKAPALISPALIGVVYYRSSLDKERHQTGFIYEIGFWDPAKGITVTALDPRSDGNIPPDRIRIRHHPYADGHID